MSRALKAALSHPGESRPREPDPQHGRTPDARRNVPPLTRFFSARPRSTPLHRTVFLRSPAARM